MHCINQSVYILGCSMRHHAANATKGGWDPANMDRAVKDVQKKNMSERTARSVYGVKRSTLKRRLKELQNGGSLSSKPYNSSMKVFTSSEENQLVDYCLRASKMGYGLCPIKLRSLAYEYAAKLNKRSPHSRHGRLKLGCTIALTNRPNFPVYSVPLSPMHITSDTPCARLHIFPSRWMQSNCMH